MKRRPRFLVVIASAVITFGVLMATVGHRHFKCENVYSGHFDHSFHKKHDGAKE